MQRPAKKTNTTSASHADIKKQLDKKRQSNDDKKPASARRTNPADPMVAVSKKLRYRALLNKGDTAQIVSSPKLLADFLEYGAQMAFDKGMRLVDFETASVKQRQYYVGLWEKGAGTSILTKPLPVVEFNKLHKENKQKGLRLADFELLQKHDEVQVASLWQPGNLDEQFSPTMSAKGFKQRNAVLKQTDMYPVDIEVRVKAGKIRYAALWRRSRPDSPTGPVSEPGAPSLLAMPTGFMPVLESTEFRATRDELVKKGKQPADIERIEKGGKVYFSALWIDGKGPGKVSKPRNIDHFKAFIKSSDTSSIEDLEIHLKME